MLGRFGHYRIARSERRGDLPGEDRSRKVPWADAYEYAARREAQLVALARRAGQYVGSREKPFTLRRVVAQEIHGFANFREAVGETLARFGDAPGHELRCVVLEELCRPAQELGALTGRRFAPAREPIAGCVYGLERGRLVGEVHGPNDPPSVSGIAAWSLIPGDAPAGDARCSRPRAGGRLVERRAQFRELQAIGEIQAARVRSLRREELPGQRDSRVRVHLGGARSVDRVGDDGLSEFTLRVYDAKNGKFLWEGRLDLRADIDPDVAAFPVVAHVRSRAAVVRIFNRTRTSGQPYFVLRAINPETGQLVWGDQFSANAANAKTEHACRSVIGMTEVAPSEIDFRIKMPDEAGRQVLWEDKIVPGLDEELAVPERSDDPGMLPVWPYGSI